MQERQTKQKQIIYDALMRLNHPTATEVYGNVHEEYPTVSRATVFRVLGGFASNGKALEIRVAGDEVRYDYNVMPHYHAHCRDCGKVADVMPTRVKIEGGDVCMERDFDVEGYSIEFFGICKECKMKKV